MTKNDQEFEKIILISLDTLRADCILANPRKEYKKQYKVNTKINDSVANEIFSKGFFFNNVISAAPYTSASHAAYFSGKWPKNNGLYDQFNSKLRAKNIFQIFSRKGYETIFKTDFPFILGKYLNLIKGVDKYYIEDNESALKQLKKKKKQLAFFHFGQIHYPYGFHNLKYGGKDYENKILSLEKKYKIDTGKMNLDDMAMESFRSDRDIELLYRYKKIIAHLYRNKLDSDLFNLYLEGLNYFNKNNLDGFLEKLLDRLESENYLLVIFSDHGEAWNDRSYGHHNTLDESVIRVPMVFYYKGVKPKIYSNRIRSIDLAPTLCSFIKDDKNKFDGKNLTDIVFNNKIDTDREAFSAIWVNESNDVVKKVKALIKTDKLISNKSRSVKYGASAHKNNEKYIEYYKQFINRSEHLKKSDIKEVFEIKKNLELNKLKSKPAASLKNIIKKLNSIELQSNSSSNKIREYLRLQGYKV